MPLFLMKQFVGTSTYLPEAKRKSNKFNQSGVAKMDKKSWDAASTCPTVRQMFSDVSSER